MVPKKPAHPRLPSIVGPMAWPEADPLRWRVGQRLDHGDPVVLLIDPDPEASVVPRRGEPQIGVVFGPEQCRMGVAELLQQRRSRDVYRPEGKLPEDRPNGGAEAPVDRQLQKAVEVLNGLIAGGIQWRS